MVRLRIISEVEDPRTGMKLERAYRRMEGEWFTAALVVNDAEEFDELRYVKSGDVWILLGCPKGMTRAGKCGVAQIAQHVLYRSFDREYPGFMRGELQRTWERHRTKLEALRRTRQ